MSTRNVGRENRSNNEQKNPNSLVDQQAIDFLNNYPITEDTKLSVLKNALKKTKAYIAGSLPLLAVTKTKTWKPSDVDIWVQQNDSKFFDPVQEFHPVLTKHGFHYSGNLSTESSQYLRLKSHVKKIHVYKNDIIVIQIIVTVTDVVLDVIPTFDFTICQVMFDGQTIQMQPNVAKDIINFKLKISEEAMNQTAFEWIRTFKRMGKYLARGFIPDSYFFKEQVYPTIISLIVTRSYKRPRSERQLILNKANLLNLARSLNKQIANLPVEFQAKIEILSNSSNYQLATFDFRENLDDVWSIKTTGELGSNTIISLKEITTIYTPSLNQRLRRAHGVGGKYKLPNTELLETIDFLTVRDLERYRAITGGTCFDVEELEEENVLKFLNDDPDENIVILDDDTHLNGVCWKRTNLRNITKDLSAISLPCAGPSGGFPVDERKKFYKISAKNYQAFIPENDLNFLLNSSNNIFQLEKTGVTILTTASASSIINRDFVSADHCQDGTSKIIHRLIPVKQPDEQPHQTTTQEDVDEQPEPDQSTQHNSFSNLFSRLFS